MSLTLRNAKVKKLAKKTGLVFKPLELELPFDELADWNLVQNKQLVSLSRNAGNRTALLKIKMVDGRLNLDCFRQPAHVIHSHIQDELELVPGSDGPLRPTSRWPEYYSGGRIMGAESCGAE